MFLSLTHSHLSSSSNLHNNFCICQDELGECINTYLRVAQVPCQSRAVCSPCDRHSGAEAFGGNAMWFPWKREESTADRVFVLQAFRLTVNLRPSDHDSLAMYITKTHKVGWQRDTVWPRVQMENKNMEQPKRCHRCQLAVMGEVSTK